jgi:hypothetical protein
MVIFHSYIKLPEGSVDMSQILYTLKV